jgi:predicted dienelactone hydrolase
MPNIEPPAANVNLHHDPRIKAVFSIEPAEGPAIIPESLAAIDIPIAFVAGYKARYAAQASVGYLTISRTDIKG